MNDRPDQFYLQLPTLVMVSNLRILLDGYAPQLVDILLCGFSFGFRIHFQGAEQSFEARNLRSALEIPAAVDAKLQKDWEQVGLLDLLLHFHLKIFVSRHWAWCLRNSQASFA